MNATPSAATGPRTDPRLFAAASLLVSYPADDPSSLEERAALAELEVGGPCAEDWERVREALARALRSSTDELRAHYIALFERGGGVSLYETEYGRSRLTSKGSVLADVAGFYRAFGFDLAETAHDMADHLAVELEFYGLLLLKEQLLEEQGDGEGLAIVEDARRKFLRDHLAGLARSALERAPEDTSRLFEAAIHFCGALVREECACLGVELPAPTPLVVVTDEKPEEALCCGSDGLG